MIMPNNTECSPGSREALSVAGIRVRRGTVILNGVIRAIIAGARVADDREVDPAELYRIYQVVQTVHDTAQDLEAKIAKLLNVEPAELFDYKDGGMLPGWSFVTAAAGLPDDGRKEGGG